MRIPRSTSFKIQPEDVSRLLQEVDKKNSSSQGLTTAQTDQYKINQLKEAFQLKKFGLVKAVLNAYPELRESEFQVGGGEEKGDLLSYAVIWGWPSAVQRVLKLSNYNLPRALMKAIECLSESGLYVLDESRFGMIKIILKRIREENLQVMHQKLWCGQTPLEHGAGLHPEVLDLLIQAFQRDCPDQTPDSAFAMCIDHYVESWNNEEYVRRLKAPLKSIRLFLQAGVDPNHFRCLESRLISIISGSSPLNVADTYGMEGLKQLLLKQPKIKIDAMNQNACPAKSRLAVLKGKYGGKRHDFLEGSESAGQCAI